MHINVDRDSSVPIYLQIARQVRQSIVDGQTASGERLPPERRLAALLGVNRTTVVNAYRELAADGLVSGQVGRGTIVTYGSMPESAASSRSPSAHLESPVSEDAGNGLAWHVGAHENGRGRTTGVPWHQLFTGITDVMVDPLLRDAMTAAARPDVIRFQTGIPAPELYPIDTIRALFNEALAATGQSLLQHTPTEGYAPLRAQLAGWMERQAATAESSIQVDPRDVVVAAGSQQGLYLLARTLIEPGDVVVVESPTYIGAAQVFRAAGARLLSIPIDQDGMHVDLLHDLLPRRRPKLIYTLPTFQNPSGTVMSIRRRKRLLDLAARYQIPVIEDDPYGALRYEGRALPTLYALDRTANHDGNRGNVIYLSTVSKMLFPGLRIGWIAAPRPVIERLTLMKQLVDLDTNALAQWVVWAFFDRGLIDTHLQRVIRLYPRRRDRMLAAIRRAGGGLIDANRPAGGLYLWCRLAEGLRSRDLLPEAAREGVMFAPGEAFHVDTVGGRGRSEIRLNFTLTPEDELDEGIRRLAAATHKLARQLEQAGRPVQPLEPVTPIV
jgi:DNA-binding transcriptional MocR family regulator